MGWVGRWGGRTWWVGRWAGGVVLRMTADLDVSLHLTAPLSSRGRAVATPFNAVWCQEKGWMTMGRRDDGMMG